MGIQSCDTGVTNAVECRIKVLQRGDVASWGPNAVTTSMKKAVLPQVKVLHGGEAGRVTP